MRAKGGEGLKWGRRKGEGGEREGYDKWEWGEDREIRRKGRGK